MVHVVAQCHEEGLEHYLRSYIKVPLVVDFVNTSVKAQITDLDSSLLSVCVKARTFLLHLCENGSRGAGQSHDRHSQTIYRLFNQQQDSEGNLNLCFYPSNSYFYWSRVFFLTIKGNLKKSSSPISISWTGLLSTDLYEAKIGIWLSQTKPSDFRTGSK